MNIAIAFVRLAELAVLLDVKFNQGDVGKAWEYTIIEEGGRPEWKIAVNGHRHAITSPLFEGTIIPSCRAHVTYNGWPWGILAPNGGECMNGSYANEDQFIRVVEGEIRRLGGTPTDAADL